LATRTCQSLCPECAAKDMKRKSERRKALAEAGVDLPVPAQGAPQ
jgi:hypothetical protein